LCCGYGADEMPIGLQIVGRFRDEASVLRAATLYEASEDWLARRPVL
jgi:aspartyl-tRNA(Asn)/glutamyl-tRNA(Gln) amidotransferase subunit A